ncbi:biotin transporter BioY [Eggerthellaceae bacterium zg-1084]|uniref:biotin transporter BioY n=1 Tax=Berryella wangjianweii TaxID=2734634 RepID=UPI001553EF22|nr:biotin transporter BioY [Berryella wangjianweii]NPD30593.1 biotin transporter BioY [Berryella wangjianweii]NPD32189.1 biotin transporter BioY [Eggerthellaceae bacterium zg-997]
MPLRSAASTRERTRDLAVIALTIAIIAVSAWVTIPLGPIPFTLQLFALMFAVMALEPRQCVAAVAGYVALGALGAPVFSGMRGGIGVLMGPTGGFIWGFLIAAIGAAALLHLLRRSGMDNALGCALAGLSFVAVAYACGTAQLMLVMGMSLEAALAAAVAPFIVVDLIKLAAATATARAVVRARRVSLGHGADAR